mgnify:CR=1 FL=1
MQSRSQARSSSSLHISNAAETVAKPISGISIICDWGPHHRGESAGLYSQADVVEGYGQRLNEELEYESVRAFPVDTRKAPWRTEAERLADVPDGFVPLFVSCDWHAKERRDRQYNASSVEFSGDYYKLADALCFAMAEWGRCYVFGHRVLRPVAVEPVAEGRGFVRVKPFALNGPHADEYLKRLDKLGEDLGRAIGGFLAGIGQGIRR